MSTSEAWTSGIRVAVNSDYVPEQSDPRRQRYIFSYEVTISNGGLEVVQLISRHWIIRDATHQIEEVRGPGVIGQQPYIEPGKSFTYKSFCQLKTPNGSMRGSYQMQKEDGQIFDAEIAEFQLKPSYTIH